jgi:hypothetical protein
VFFTQTCSRSTKRPTFSTVAMGVRVGKSPVQSDRSRETNQNGQDENPDFTSCLHCLHPPRFLSVTPGWRFCDSHRSWWWKHLWKEVQGAWRPSSPAHHTTAEIDWPPSLRRYRTGMYWLKLERAEKRYLHKNMIGKL